MNLGLYWYLLCIYWYCGISCVKMYLLGLQNKSNIYLYLI